MKQLHAIWIPSLVFLVGLCHSSTLTPRRRSLYSYFRPTFQNRVEDAIFDVVRDFRQVFRNEIRNRQQQQQKQQEQQSSPTRCGGTRRRTVTTPNPLDSSPKSGEPFLNFSFKDDCVLVSLGSQKVYGRCGRRPESEGRRLDMGPEDVEALQEDFPFEDAIHLAEETRNLLTPTDEDKDWLPFVDNKEHPFLESNHIPPQRPYPLEVPRVFDMPPRPFNHRPHPINDINNGLNKGPHFPEHSRPNFPLPHQPFFPINNNNNERRIDETQWRPFIEPFLPPHRPDFNFSPINHHRNDWKPFQPPPFPHNFPFNHPKPPITFQGDSLPPPPTRSQFLNLAQSGLFPPPLASNPVVLVAVAGEDSSKPATLRPPPFQTQESPTPVPEDQFDETENSTTTVADSSS